MAEGRMLKRRITASKKMARLKTDKARLLWFYMLPFTDVDGRVIADCEDIRDEIIRKQRNGYSLAKIEQCLQDLRRAGLIVLYEVNGIRYLELTRFWKEQSHNRDREAKSDIPSPNQGALQSAPEHLQSNPLKLSKVKLSKEKEKHLDFVFLTKEEHQKLVRRYGEIPTGKLIDSLNRYIGQSGKKYKSHYYTLLNFARRDDLKELPTPETKEKQAAALEKKRQEIRGQDGRYFREQITEKLKSMLADPKDQRRITRGWLIKEIIAERNKQ